MLAVDLTTIFLRSWVLGDIKEKTGWSKINDVDEIKRPHGFIYTTMADEISIGCFEICQERRDQPVGCDSVHGTERHSLQDQ